MFSTGDAEAVETVNFTVDGHSYECDLCELHLAEFRESMEDWTHARLVGRRRLGPSAGRSIPSGRRGRAPGCGPSAAEVQEWTRAQGVLIDSRGGLRAEVQAAHAAVH
jgi:hypothetical protein